MKVTKLLLTVSLATLIALGVTDAYAQSAKANSCPDGSTPNCIPAEDTYFLWRGRQITDPASNIREDQKLEYSRSLRRFPTLDSCLSADTEPGGPPIEYRLAWDRFLRNSDAEVCAFWQLSALGNISDIRKWLVKNRFHIEREQVMRKTLAMYFPNVKHPSYLLALWTTSESGILWGGAIMRMLGERVSKGGNIIVWLDSETKVLGVELTATSTWN